MLVLVLDLVLVLVQQGRSLRSRARRAAKTVATTRTREPARCALPRRKQMASPQLYSSFRADFLPLSRLQGGNPAHFWVHPHEMPLRMPLLLRMRASAHLSFGCGLQACECDEDAEFEYDDWSDDASSSVSNAGMRL